jgi:hypothetical protein
LAPPLSRRATVDWLVPMRLATSARVAGAGRTVTGRASDDPFLDGSPRTLPSTCMHA